MEEFNPSLARYKDRNTEPKPEKKIEKVVHGDVKVRKKSGLEKAKGLLISDDAANVKSYVLRDVLIPALKKAISDIVTNGIEMILYGESGRARRSGPSGGVSYRNFYDNPRSYDRPAQTVVAGGYDLNDIVVTTRGEAEDVLTRMDELIETYGVVSVADLYELIGVPSNYTDNKYGWTSMASAEPIHVRDGYLLRLPKVRPI